MKKAIIILSIIFITISVKSQFYSSWTEPMALTDSLSFNSNPSITNSWSYVFMFYEKRQTPQGLSQIWRKEVTDTLAEEQLFIEGLPGFDYRNPIVLNHEILVYESNVSGNYDIYGIKFDEFGAVGNSFQLTNTEYDESSFYGENNWYPYCCWESNGDIIVAETDYYYPQDSLQFINQITIDTSNCHDPSCSDDFIVWRKTEGNESHIYSSSIENPEPGTVTFTGNSINLSMSKSNSDEGDSFCWESLNKIYFRSINGNTEIFSPDFSGIENYNEPTSFNVIYFTKELPNLYSFVGESDSTKNIYIAGYYTTEPFQLTNDSLVQKNPRLFMGRHIPGGFDAYNIWQTVIEGHEVLYISMKSYITADLKENNNIALDISPNPVSNNQNITISTAENIQVYSAQIYSVSGELILETDFDSHSCNYEINIGNAFLGVYFIKIQTSEGESVKRLIIK